MTNNFYQLHSYIYHNKYHFHFSKMNTSPFYKRRKFWKRFLLFTLALPIFLAGVSVGIVYIKQDDIVQTLISTLNKDFKGKIEVKDSHITAFDNFPYISVDLEDVKI